MSHLPLHQQYLHRQEWSHPTLQLQTQGPYPNTHQRGHHPHHLPQLQHRTWKESLAFLHQLDLQPTPYRSLIWHKVGYSQAKALYNIYSHILRWILAATDDHHRNDDQPQPPHQTSALPFWNLLFLFDALMLHPFTLPNHNAISDDIRYRISLFKRGDIKTLYNHAFPNRDPPQHTTFQTATESNPDFNDLSHCEPAQRAADADNLSMAYSRITKTLPLAPVTPTTKPIIDKLYPPRIHRTQPPNTRHNQRTATTPKVTLTTTTVLATLRKLKKATAPGPFGTCTDFLRGFGLFRKFAPDSKPEHPHLPALTAVLNLLANNRLPPAAALNFASQYFVAFYKDPTDLTKIRPIGIGSALRRLVGACIMEAFGHRFTDAVLPFGQLGINIPGGLDTIIHSTLSELFTYIDSKQSPTRALLLLDIKNMFNSCSRDACRTKLSELFPELLPYFDLLYKHPVPCWHNDQHGQPDNFLQHEGFTQGCPLSGVFAALVFIQLLEPLLSELRQRSDARQHTQCHANDDGLGGRSGSSSYHDDTSSMLPHIDLLWFIKRFNELGKPLGIQLNLIKTKILTSTSGSSPPLPPPERQALQAALDYLQEHGNTTPEITTGTRLLGFPIGSMTFADGYLNLATEELQTNTTRLQHRLTDLQTQGMLYRSCAIASASYRLAADVYHHFQTNAHPSIFDWQPTPFTNAFRHITKQHLAHLAGTIDIPDISYNIAALPNSLGGLGFRDPNSTAVLSLLTPLIRSIRHATTGISIGDSVLHLPHHIRQHLDHWQTSNCNTYKALRHYLPSLLQTHRHG